MTEPIRALLVDDDPFVRSALSMLLGADPGLEVVGEAADPSPPVREAPVPRVVRPVGVCPAVEAVWVPTAVIKPDPWAVAPAPIPPVSPPPVRPV